MICEGYTLVNMLLGCVKLLVMFASLQPVGIFGHIHMFPTGGFNLPQQGGGMFGGNQFNPYQQQQPQMFPNQGEYSQPGNYAQNFPQQGNGGYPNNKYLGGNFGQQNPFSNFGRPETNPFPNFNNGQQFKQNGYPNYNSGLPQGYPSKENKEKPQQNQVVPGQAQTQRPDANNENYPNNPPIQTQNGYPNYNDGRPQRFPSKEYKERTHETQIQPGQSESQIPNVNSGDYPIIDDKKLSNPNSAPPKEVTPAKPYYDENNPEKNLNNQPGNYAQNTPQQGNGGFPNNQYFGGNFPQQNPFTNFGRPQSNQFPNFNNKQQFRPNRYPNYNDGRPQEFPSKENNENPQQSQITPDQTQTQRPNFNNGNFPNNPRPFPPIQTQNVYPNYNAGAPQGFPSKEYKEEPQENQLEPVQTQVQNPEVNTKDAGERSNPSNQQDIQTQNDPKLDVRHGNEQNVEITDDKKLSNPISALPKEATPAWTYYDENNSEKVSDEDLKKLTKRRINNK